MVNIIPDSIVDGPGGRQVWRESLSLEQRVASLEHDYMELLALVADLAGETGDMAGQNEELAKALLAHLAGRSV